MLLAVAVLAGCAGPRVYSAARLPAQYRATPLGSAHKVDLSRLAGPPADSTEIQPGDLIEVSLAASLTPEGVTTLVTRVDDNGTASFPELGPVYLAGLDLVSAERQITSACVQRGLYRQPNVSVSFKRQRTNRVTVVGAVEEPGVYDLPRPSSYLMGALVAAGGLADNAGAQVDIRQPGQPSAMAGIATADGVQPASAAIPEPAPVRVCLNLNEAVMQPGGGTYLADGSVIRVETLEPEPVEVLGLVKKPGQVDFPVKHDLRLFGAIAAAGGVSTFAADRVMIIRQQPDGQPPVTINVSLMAAKRDPEQNLLLAPGDIVSVEQTPATLALEMLNLLRFGIGTSVSLF